MTVFAKWTLTADELVQRVSGWVTLRAAVLVFSSLLILIWSNFRSAFPQET